MLHSQDGFPSEIFNPDLVGDPPPPASPCTGHESIADRVHCLRRHSIDVCVPTALHSVADSLRICLRRLK